MLIQGWVLLALCVALVNAGSGLSALWILLSCVGYMIFLLYLVKPVLNWLFKRTGSIDNGPSQSVIALILLVALASAFFTAIIGVHAIFGGFMVGLILPRENRFNIIIIEKLEDLIGALFLPLYFTLSGLNTNLGLLDTGITWGYVFAVTFLAFFAKFFSASAGARLNGLVWRESFSIGVLMSCKGLVELIVLVSLLSIPKALSHYTIIKKRGKLTISPHRTLVCLPILLARGPLPSSLSWLSSLPLLLHHSLLFSTRRGTRRSWPPGRGARLTGIRAQRSRALTPATM